VRGQVESREYLCATLTADHDLIDGAPLARFIRRLKALVEDGSLLAADEVPVENTAAG
jgi:pyruvate/2-oxoglutarate dehydrogenase complex dihydrolipoamide acyltransferase (E2) component